MTQEEEMWLRELAAERCVISKVTARLGPMSLWSNDALKAEIRRAVEAEREACAKIVDDSYETTTPNQGIPEDWLLTLAEQIRARGEA
jgi:hypothetical protein